MPEPIPAAALYRGYRFPPEIISYAVWLYLRFSLSLRDVEELLAERGVAVTYETIGQWVRRFGPVFAGELRRRGRRPGDKLHLDEVALKINGRRHWLWRAVDQHGFVVDILVQSRRDQDAAETFIRRAVGGWDYTPRVVITYKLASYPPALRRVLPVVEHRRHKGLNNRAENSHLPTRQRERRMQRFKSSEQAQRFFGSVHRRLQSLSPAAASLHGKRLELLHPAQDRPPTHVNASVGQNAGDAFGRSPQLQVVPDSEQDDVAGKAMASDEADGLTRGVAATRTAGMNGATTLVVAIASEIGRKAAGARTHRRDPTRSVDPTPMSQNPASWCAPARSGVSESICSGSTPGVGRS